MPGDSESESRRGEEGSKSPKKSDKKGKRPLPSLFGHLDRSEDPAAAPPSSSKRKTDSAHGVTSPRKKSKHSKSGGSLYAPASPRKPRKAGKYDKDPLIRGPDFVERKRREESREKERETEEVASSSSEEDEETRLRKAAKVARATERARRKGKLTPNKASMGLSDFSDDVDDDVKDKTFVPGKEDESDDDDDDDDDDEEDEDEEGDGGDKTITGAPTPSHKSSETEKSKVKKRRSSASRKRSSPVWNYFKPCEKNPDKYVVCIVKDKHTNLQCGARIKRTDQSTTGLLKHLRQHKQAYADVLKTKAQQVVGDATDTSLVITSQKELASAEDKAREILGKSPQVRRMPKTKTLESYFEKQPSHVKYPVQSESQKRIDLAIMTYLARCNLPLSTVDHPGFKE